MAASFLVGSQLYKVNCPPSEYLWEHLGLLPKQPLLHARVCSWSPCEVGGGVCRKRPLPPSTGQRSGIFLLLPSQKHVTQPLPVFLARLGLAAAGSTALPLPRARQCPVLRPASGLDPLVSHCSSRPGGLHPCLEMCFPLKMPRCSLQGFCCPWTYSCRAGPIHLAWVQTGSLTCASLPHMVGWLRPKPFRFHLAPPTSPVAALFRESQD